MKRDFGVESVENRSEGLTEIQREGGGRTKRRYERGHTGRLPLRVQMLHHVCLWQVSGSGATRERSSRPLPNYLPDLKERETGEDSKYPYNV